MTVSNSGLETWNQKLSVVKLVLLLTLSLLNWTSLQAQTILNPTANTTLAFDYEGMASNPFTEIVLSTHLDAQGTQLSKSSDITTFTVNGQEVQFNTLNATLVNVPTQPFYLSVRVRNPYGISVPTNVIGPFVLGVAPNTPTTLRVVPLPPN